MSTDTAMPRRVGGSPPRSFTRASGAILAAPLLALAACAPADRAGSDTPADSADLYAARVMESLGGQDAWDDTRYVAFRWIVERDGQIVSERRHAWDRHDGRYRLEYTSGDAPHVALFNEKRLAANPGLGKVPEGRVWREGSELIGAPRDSALARAYAMFINDTYWLLMPFKWRDPGVHLAYEGTRTLSDGTSYPVVHLTFDQGLGVTEDQYWAFVDPATGRMAAWQYHLGRSADPGPVIWWEGWTPIGDLLIPLRRRSEDDGPTIRFEDVEASPTVPDGAFAPPMP